MTICTKLSVSAMSEVNQLKKTIENERSVRFKLEPDYLFQTNLYSRHFLCYQKSLLLAYAFLDFSDPQVLEVTLISADKQELLVDCLAAITQFARQRAIPTVLLITDSRDLILTRELNQVPSHILQFFEYRLILDTSIFEPPQELLPLRYAEVDEALQIARLQAETTEEALVPLLPEDLAKTLVYIKNNEIIGCIRIEESLSACGLYGFVLAPDHRGQGLGRAMLATVIQQLLAKEQKEIYLEAEANNHSALHLYTKMGFKKETLFAYYRIGLAI